MRIMQRPQGASVFKDDKGNFDRNKLNKYMQKIYIENIWCFAKDKKTGVFDFLKEGTLEKFLYDI